MIFNEIFSYFILKMESIITSNLNTLDINSNMNIVYDSNMLYNIACEVLSNNPHYTWSNITITDNDVLVTGNPKK